MPLNNNECRIVLGMVARKDNRHDIAAWFGVNQARIAEVEQGELGNFEAAPAEELPPKGPPGIKGRRMLAFSEKALRLLDEGNAQEAAQALRDGIDRFNRSE